MSASDLQKRRNSQNTGERYQIRQRVLDLEKNGTNYGTRDKSLADYLKQGNTIEFCWIENRGHRVVTTLRKVPSKDDQILKMSYLSPPYRLVSRIGINPKKSKRLTLEVAKEFEEYVKRG